MKRKVMLFIGLCVATYIWYNWFRGEVPHFDTWEEIQAKYETKQKKIRRGQLNGGKRTRRKRRRLPLHPIGMMTIHPTLTMVRFTKDGMV